MGVGLGSGGHGGGGAGDEVVNEAVAPLVVPAELVADARKKYVVPGASPLRDALTGTALDPVTGFGLAVGAPRQPVLSALFVQTVKEGVEFDPLAFTVAFTTAVVLVTADADPVVTDGGEP